MFVLALGSSKPQSHRHRCQEALERAGEEKLRRHRGKGELLHGHEGRTLPARKVQHAAAVGPAAGAARRTNSTRHTAAHARKAPLARSRNTTAAAAAAE